MNGRRFVPSDQDRQMVMLMAAMGFTDEQMGRQIAIADGGICPKTLNKHFAEEKATGLDRILMKVAGNLVGIATSATHKNAHVAAIYIMKSRAGWADRPTAEITVPGAAAGGGKLPEPDEHNQIVIRLNMAG